MNKRDLWLFLAIQLLLAVLVVGIFMILSRQHGGLVAGSLFCGTAVFMRYRTLQWLDRRKSLTFWALPIYLFGISIPMLATRLIHWGVPFSDLSVFWIPAPLFHRIANGVFLAVTAAMLVDLARKYRQHPPVRQDSGIAVGEPSEIP